MTLSTFRVRARKALRMTPRQLAGRLREELREQTKRPWASLYPRLLTNAAVVSGSGAASLDDLWVLRARSGPFFLHPSDRLQWTAAFEARYPEQVAEIVRRAETILRHEFDLLGSGPVSLGVRLPWHTDFKTGREWPLRYCRDIEYLELDRPTDVKVPWELSRAQHLPLLGQAFWLTGDERFAREIVAQVDDWIATNPLAYGVNWACAMDVALRSVSWLWAFYFVADAEACAAVPFRERCLRSLFLHGQFVSRNLETSDINGNHYLSDAVGLVFLGAFFRHTPAGASWLATGRRIVTDEIFAQVTPDGVDHEASTSYHRLVLELFLIAYLQLEHAGEQVPPACWERLACMLDFVGAYTKPDGRIPLVGDADDGRVQKLGLQELNDHRSLLSTAAVRLSRGDHKNWAGRFWEESFWLLGPAGAAAFDALPAAADARSSVAFPDGGFYVLRSPVAHVFVDCGDVGLRGRGGHGHNDCLSFELFLDGVNLVTDCGAFLYTASREWRNKFRSTAFHNTIQIDGEELNRFVDPTALWQLHYDAVPVDVRWKFGEQGSYWQGSHAGYRRLPKPSQPRRTMWLHPGQPLLAVRDAVDGSGVHRVTWRWHLDPACEVRLDGADACITSGGRACWMLAASPSPAPFRLDDGWVSSAYGVKNPTRVIVVDAEARLPVSFSYVFATVRLSEVERAHALAALDRAGASE